MQATVAAILHTYTATGVDRLGVATLEFTSVELSAYWFLATSEERGADVLVKDLTVEHADLGVPPSWPDVTPQDRITVAGRVWEVDGSPIDYSLGPFTDQWVQLTGEKPATVIHLCRQVG